MEEKLKAPMNFKWRVQSVRNGKATCVAYIDARQVMDRLDEVVGFNKWQSEYYSVEGNVYCKIGVNLDGEWIWKSDCGTESNVEKEKGQASDAFKRAAVKWGIGRFLYSMEMVQLDASDRTPVYNGRKLYGDQVTKACNYILSQKSK